MRRSGCDDGGGIQARGQFGDLLDQGVGEDVLGDADGHRAAKAVEEDGHRVARGHVFLAEHDLHGDEWDLHARARADAREDLVPDPGADVAVDLQCVQHAAADGEDCAADPGEGDVGAQRGDGSADDDAGDCNRDEVGNCADSGAFGCGALDGLEVEGEVEDVRI